MRRRRFVAAVALAPALASGSPAARADSRALEFPRDFGAHPDYRIEWWYATGHLDAAGVPLGFQITFFRARHDTQATGRFAARQMLFAHAAMADPREGRLLHAETAARAGFADAYAQERDTALAIGHWRMARDATSGAYRVGVPAATSAQPVGFDLALAPTQAVLLEGDRGHSRKGRSGDEWSYYYSQPHLDVSGTVAQRGQTRAVHGRAWLDHEWSDAYLDPRAAGWDWIGANMHDGAALMAFRIRARDDPSRTLWASATLRDAHGRTRTFEPHDVAFAPVRYWTSPRTGASYPVACRVGVGDERYDVEPLFDDQELDSRAATGFVYWEGAVAVRSGEREVGKGYLELTGYAEPLRLSR